MLLLWGGSKDKQVDSQGIRQLIDIYSAGCPCQPFSNIGQHGGSKDARSEVFRRVSGLY